MSGPIALATVSSRDFALGTAVALDSFRSTNPWFDGDAVVIADDLGDDDRTLIARTGRTAFRRPSAELVQRIDALCAARPVLAPKRSRFFSLEAFAVTGCERVLFLDSDVVVTGDFAELLTCDAAFVATADSATLRGERRDPTSFAPTTDLDGIASFNAGMMLFDAGNRGPGTYRSLLDGLDPEAWAAVESDHTDQIVLNRRFARGAALADARYNLLVGHQASGFATADVPLGDVRMFHFNGPLKPWAPARIVERALADPLVHHAWSQWHRALDRMIARAHLARIAAERR